MHSFTYTINVHAHAHSLVQRLQQLRGALRRAGAQLEVDRGAHDLSQVRRLRQVLAVPRDGVVQRTRRRLDVFLARVERHQCRHLAAE